MGQLCQHESDGAKSFEEYAGHVAFPYISKQLQYGNRIDVVWYSFKKNNLNTNRVREVYSWFNAFVQIPDNWQCRLCVVTKMLVSSGWKTWKSQQHVDRNCAAINTL